MYQVLDFLFVQCKAFWRIVMSAKSVGLLARLDQDYSTLPSGSNAHDMYMNLKTILNP